MVNVNLNRLKVEQWINILEAIENTGSMNKACETLQITYRTILKRLRKLADNYPEKIIESFHGGHTRGGTELTLFGQSLLSQLKDCISVF